MTNNQSDESRRPTVFVADSAPDQSLIVDTARRLSASELRLVSAESCTGGLVAACLTDQAGSSAWFEGAFVTYRLSAKVRLLGVPQQLLDRYGAVSEPTARAMAEGALRFSDADLSVAITGVAGPSGGEPHTPVGTVWFAWALRDPDIHCVQTARHLLTGSRTQIRHQAVNVALHGVNELLVG